MSKTINRIALAILSKRAESLPACEPNLHAARAASSLHRSPEL
jgi:hypothetical protein